MRLSSALLRGGCGGIIVRPSLRSRSVKLTLVPLRWRANNPQFQSFRLPPVTGLHCPPEKFLRTFITTGPSHAEKVNDILLNLESARAASDPSNYAKIADKAESVALTLSPESEDAVRIRAAIASGWWERAQTMSEIDALQQVITCHKHQLALVPKHLLAHKGLGMALYELAQRGPSKGPEEKKRQLMLAHDYLKIALAAKQRDVELNRYMVQVARELKMYVQAMDYCRKAIRKVPPYEFDSATASRRLNPAVQWFHTQLVELKELAAGPNQKV